jgi:integrase
MASLYTKRGVYYLRHKDPYTGKWKSKSTRTRDPAIARRVLKEVERAVEGIAEARERGEIPSNAPLTVATWAEVWLRSYREGRVADAGNDRARLRDWILPVIGQRLLSDVRARHIREIVRGAQSAGKAPRTVYNIYSVCCALFRDAIRRDLITASPCQLGKEDLGAKVDQDPEWRCRAIYAPQEVALLVADARLKPCDRVAYALMALAGLRHGEMAGLRWRHIQPGEPLQKLIVARSYDGRTKEQTTIEVPIHPVLQRVLDDWRVAGWQQVMGREPEADDLVCLRPTAPHSRMRTPCYTGYYLTQQLEQLGLRHTGRRCHALRATFITQCEEVGMQPLIAQRFTHTPPRADARSGYARPSWAARCNEMLKLNWQPVATALGDPLIMPRFRQALLQTRARREPGGAAAHGDEAGLLPALLPQFPTPYDDLENVASPTGFEPVSPA